MNTINRRKVNAVEAHIAKPQPNEECSLIDMLCELVDFWPRCATCATHAYFGESDRSFRFYPITFSSSFSSLPVLP